MKDSCYKCLKAGHMSKDCTLLWEVSTHHRSMCPKKYASNFSTAHLVKETDETAEIDVLAEENVLVSSEEMVQMQTARAEIHSPNNSVSEHVRILLDSGSQGHMRRKVWLKN